MGRTEAAILYWANKANKAYRADKANNAIRANRSYKANRQIKLVLYSTLEMLFKSNTFLVRKKILTLSIILIHHDRFY